MKIKSILIILLSFSLNFSFAQGFALDGTYIINCDSTVTEVNQYGVLGNCSENTGNTIYNFSNTPFYNYADSTFGFVTSFVDLLGNTIIDTTLFEVCDGCYSLTITNSVVADNVSTEIINGQLVYKKYPSSLRVNPLTGQIELLLADEVILPLNLSNLPSFLDENSGINDPNIVSGGLFKVNNQLYVKP